MDLFGVMKTTINSEQSLNSYIEHIKTQFEKHKYLRMDMKTGKQRTPTQNKCLHKYCEMVADELNDKGITFTTFFKPGFEVPWNQMVIKDNVWRPVQIAMTEKESTTELTTKECSDIYENINRKLSEFGIYVPWPSKETMNDD